MLTVTVPLSTTPTPGNDDITGTDGPDTIAVLESDDIVRGLGAGDLLFGKQNLAWCKPVQAAAARP